ncbi:hypothetical protein BDZ89DRAFT_1084196 [Hymenopellis radicata]|nr:hypothetical protein BDZ89DRAFT_1084196 [Hymenopellis radicata]
MPVDTRLPDVRETVADFLDAILRIWQKIFAEAGPDYSPLLRLLRKVNEIVASHAFTPTHTFTFPVRFSIWPTAYPSYGTLYSVCWDLTHRPGKRKLLGRFFDWRDPAGRYISHHWSLHASNCKGTIVLPPWHILQGIIASLRNPRPDVSVQLMLRQDFTHDGHGRKGGGTAVIVVNENNLSQVEDMIAWIPQGYQEAWECTECRETVYVTDWTTTYCMWRKEVTVGVCLECQYKAHLQQKMKAAAKGALALLLASGGKVLYDLYFKEVL